MSTRTHSRWRELRFPAALFVFLLCAYVLTMSGHQYSVDGIAMYQQSKTLLFQGTFRFSPPFRWGNYTMSYTYWPEGLSIVYIIPLAILSYIVFPDAPTFRTIPISRQAMLVDPSYVYVSPTNGVITALTASFLFVLATRFGLTRRRAGLVGAVYGVMSPALVYQKQDFAQPLAALLVVSATMLLLIASQTESKSIRHICIFLASCSLGFSVMVRSETIVLATMPLTILFLYQARHAALRGKYIAAACFFLPLSLFSAAHAMINYIKSGSFQGVQGTSISQGLTDLAVFSTGALGSLVSPGRGLFVFFPLALFAPAGLYRMYRQNQRRWAIVLGCVVGLHALLFSTWPIWWGGLSWGPRFFVPVIPFLTLLALWPRADGQTRNPYLETLGSTLKLLAVLVGLIMALAGALLPWNVYALQHNPPAEAQTWSFVEQGRWYFRPDTNLVWVAWRELGNTAGYDLLSVQLDQAALPHGQLVFSLCWALFLGAGALLSLWLRRETPESQRE